MNDAENNWDDLFEQLPLDPAARVEHQQQLKDQVLDAFEESAPRPPSILKNTGQLLMKYKVPQLTAAAAMIVACVSAFQFSGSSAFALEDLVKNIVNAKSARWESVIDIGQLGKQTVKTTVIPGHTRQENQDGSIMIFDWKAGKAISLTPASKTALQMDLGDGSKEFHEGNVFELMRSSLESHLKSGKLKAAKPEKTKSVSGRDLLGFKIDDSLTIWAEAGGDIPVEIEFMMSGNLSIVMQNYECNFPVSESTFSVNVPEGYTTTEVDLPTELPNEESFIRTLRLSCECNEDGTFPTGMDIASTAQAMASIQMHLMEDMDLSGSGPTGEQIAEMAKQTMGFAFTIQLSVDGDSNAHYAGADVKLGTKDRPIFWYKEQGSEKYRVIDAELNVRESATAPDVDGAVKLSP